MTAAITRFRQPTSSPSRSIPETGSRQRTSGWRTIRLSSQNLVIFPRSADLATASNPDFHIYTCSFPEELLAVISESLDVEELDELGRGASVIRCSAPAMELVRKCLGQLCTRIHNGASRADPELVDCATRALPTRLISAIATAHGANFPATTRKRELALVRAEEFVERSFQENIDVRDICRAAQVCQRTLKYAFVERFGVTPKASLNAHRLNSVRRELSVADPTWFQAAEVIQPMRVSEKIAEEWEISSPSLTSDSEESQLPRQRSWSSEL